jgi:hypothetical protein
MRVGRVVKGEGCSYGGERERERELTGLDRMKEWVGELERAVEAQGVAGKGWPKYLQSQKENKK